MNDIKGIIEDVEKSSLVSNKVIKKVIEIIGQEKWQDINDEEDDICTTTGELIITLKGIVDLEKENAELKLKLEALEGQTPWKDIKDKSELIKENAQLKSNRDYWRESSIYWHKQLKNKKYRKIAKATQQQLTKATELLKEFVHHYKDKTIYIENMKDLLEQAEQFLSEVEK